MATAGTARSDLSVQEIARRKTYFPESDPVAQALRTRFKVFKVGERNGV